MSAELLINLAFEKFLGNILQKAHLLKGNKGKG
jgi:hypothetical protein